MKFDKPILQIYCEDCETTNYYYSDSETPYRCDQCGKEFTGSEKDIESEN